MERNREADRREGGLMRAIALFLALFAAQAFGAD
jgi:hypothetical protein